jgi:hypothetical protein
MEEALMMSNRTLRGRMMGRGASKRRAKRTQGFIQCLGTLTARICGRKYGTWTNKKLHPINILIVNQSINSMLMRNKLK